MNLLSDKLPNLSPKRKRQVKKWATYGSGVLAFFLCWPLLGGEVSTGFEFLDAFLFVMLFSWPVYLAVKFAVQSR